MTIQKARRPKRFIDPALIFRVKMSRSPQDAEWENTGLTVLSTDPDRSLVLFTEAGDVTELLRKIREYAAGPRSNRKNAPYAALISCIEKIEPLAPSDRIGPRLKRSGITSLRDLAEDETYVVDVELWHFGERLLREAKLMSICGFVEEGGGDTIDTYLGLSLTIARIRARGSSILELFNIDEVASIDLPEDVDLSTEPVVKIDIRQVDQILDAHDELPLIGVLDSGINDNPLLTTGILGRLNFSGDDNDADEWGHGTKVGGIAMYGDLRAALPTGIVTRFANLVAVKVVNRRGAFNDRKLVPSIMRRSIEELSRNYGCRIIAMALGDAESVYNGGKVGRWAAVLDELAREFNVLIVVPTGNRRPRDRDRVEEEITAYPGYLFEAANRLLEPGAAVNALTVGSLSHGPGIGIEGRDDVKILAITDPCEPSPFTRTGEGVGGATKPDLVDFGGTLVYDAFTASLQGGEARPEAGVLTTASNFLNQLIVSASGTSYAVPFVANKAAQLLSARPESSANLLRALLVSGASVPTEGLTRLTIFLRLKLELYLDTG